MEFRCQALMWADRIDLYMIDRSGGRMSVATSFTMTEVDAGDIGPPPAISLTQTQAQELADQLWAAGIRPTHGKGSAGALAATERHLEDMRTLVFKEN